MYLDVENTGVEKGDEFHTRLAWWLTRAQQSVCDEIRSCPSPLYLLFPELMFHLLLPAQRLLRKTEVIHCHLKDLPGYSCDPYLS